MLDLRPKAIISIAIATVAFVSSTPARADDAGPRVIASLPFGAGQFQNGDVPLGIFFAAGEAVAGTASIATVFVVRALSSSAPSAPSDLVSTNGSIRTATTVNRFAFAAFASLAVAGVLEAQISLAPKRRARRDALSPSVVATASPVLGGGVMGIRVRF